MTASRPLQAVVSVAAATSEADYEHGRAIIGELVSWLAVTVALDARVQQHDTVEELDNLAEFYRLPAGQLLLGYVDGRPCATTGVHLMTAGTAELRRVWVSPAFRGHGLASQLLQAGLEVARTLGAREVWLETVSGHMDKAIGMYKRAGFAPIPHYSSLPASLPGVLSLGLQLP